MYFRSLNVLELKSLEEPRYLLGEFAKQPVACLTLASFLITNTGGPAVRACWNALCFQSNSIVAVLQRWPPSSPPTPVHRSVVRAGTCWAVCCGVSGRGRGKGCVTLAFFLTTNTGGRAAVSDSTLRRSMLRCAVLLCVAWATCIAPRTLARRWYPS